MGATCPRSDLYLPLPLGPQLVQDAQQIAKIFLRLNCQPKDPISAMQEQSADIEQQYTSFSE